MKRVYTNRRRAKDSILAYAERHGIEGIQVVVSEDGMVYIQTPDGDEALFHFGIPTMLDLETVKASEVYKGEAVRKFKT